MIKTIRAIVNFLDDEFGSWVPECGSVFHGDDCKSCKHYWECVNGIKIEKQVDKIKDIFKEELRNV